MSAPQNILVRCPNWVGDVVMATPTLRCLRETFPQARITLLLRPSAMSILEGAPWFDEAVGIEKAQGVRGFVTFIVMARLLRARKFDLGLLLTNSFSSALLFRLAGVRRRVGYSRDGRDFLLSEAVPRATRDGKFLPTYTGDTFLELCGAVGCVVRDRRPELFTTPEAERRADAIFATRGIDPARPLVVVNPGASFGSSKLWAPERFAWVADRLAEAHGCAIFICGAPGERAIGERIKSLMKTPALLLQDCGVPFDLGVLKSLVKRCALLLTLDSGPRHFAVAFDRPAVTLMGPNSPLYTETPLERGEVVRVDVDCGPCQKKVCPTDSRCMTLITQERVLEACERQMKSSNDSATKRRREE
jgi:heptosyltransferase-2